MPDEKTLVAKHVRFKDCQLAYDCPTLMPLKDIAVSDYGVNIAIFEYKGKYPDMPPKSGLYVVVCPDAHTLGVLQEGTVNLRQVLIDAECAHHNEVPCYYNPVYLGDITQKNAYQKIRQIEKAIRNVSTAKYAFQEFGCDLPRSVQQVTIDKFERYNNIRRSADLKPEVRQEYEDVYKQCVLHANELYNKGTDLSGKKVVPVSKSKSQLLEKSYFEENHITCINEVVSEDFWNYLKPRLSEQPAFHMWKDKKPSLVLKDNSDAKGVKGINIWKSQKEYKEYNVMFPVGQADIFYTWLQDYRTQDLKMAVSEDKLQEGTELTPITMPRDDLYLWDAYCESNKLNYSLNHGLFGHNTSEQIRNPIIGVRKEDRPLADAILKRMAEDKTKDVTYSQTDRQRIDRMPRKCVDNPYLRLMLMQSRTDVFLRQVMENNRKSVEKR